MYFSSEEAQTEGLLECYCPFCRAGIASINFAGVHAYCTSCRTEFTFYPRTVQEPFGVTGVEHSKSMWKRLSKKNKTNEPTTTKRKTT